MDNFPKLKSPFIRETINKRYIVTPQIDPDYKWVFEDNGVLAVDKLDGTNVGIRIENGNITRVFNRETEKFILNVNQTAWEGACLEGLGKAQQHGWLKFADGDYYGELIGEMFNSNRHQIQGHLFVPFEYLKRTCFWQSYIQNKYPKTFESISEWFKDLPSLFNQRLNFPPIQAEGLVFHHPDGRMAKLRRNMFNWFN